MTTYFIGLDLGQAQDYSALTVLECIAAERVVYHLRYLERPRLGTPYPAIVARVKQLAETEPLTGDCIVVADATGVGAAVIDLLRAAGLPLVAVTITGGDVATCEHGNWRVPKRDLVFALLTALQTGRLLIADGLSLAPVLIRELLAFKVKIDTATAHDSYASWREGDHDDLVLSAALAVWYAAQPAPNFLAYLKSRPPRNLAQPSAQPAGFVVRLPAI
jgi:hypothetical protein